MGFCWLCFGEFLLVMGVRFVGLVVLDGIAIGLAVGHGCHCRCGHGPWVVVVVLGFFLLRLLGSDGGLVFGYSGGWLCLCCGLPFDFWCWVSCAVGCGLICGFGVRFMR